MTNEQQLLAYAKEIGLTRLSLKSLIDSHRVLRLTNIEFSKERVNILNRAHETAYEEAYIYALNNFYFDSKQLKSMTIGDLVEKLNAE